MQALIALYFSFCSRIVMFFGAILIFIRVNLGLFFSISGFYKVFEANQHQVMLETLKHVGIPFPEFNAYFVPLVEFIGGFFLAIGLGTRITALLLLIISVVALLTDGLAKSPANLNIAKYYDWVLYLPEAGYILMALLLITAPRLNYAVDRWIEKRFNLMKSA